MKSLTCWKVFKCTDNLNATKTVVVGLDTDLGVGIVEEVTNVADGVINSYKLYGVPNDHFEGFQEVWSNYCTANHINSIADVSSEYKY